MSFQERQATDFLQSQRHQLDRQSQTVNNVVVQREEIIRRRREAEQDLDQLNRKEDHLDQRKENLLVERRKLQQEGRERDRLTLRRDIKFHEEQQRRKELQLQSLSANSSRVRQIQTGRSSSFLKSKCYQPKLPQYWLPSVGNAKTQMQNVTNQTKMLIVKTNIILSKYPILAGPWKTDRTALSTPNKGIERNFEPSVAMRDLEDPRPSDTTLDTASKFSFASRFFTRKSN